MGKQRVRIRRLNFDVLFYQSIISGCGFVISEPPSVRIEDGEPARKSLYGPRSYLYGTTFEDEQTYAERFTCECGALKGRMYEGEICEFCGKPVKEVGDNIKVTGWIDLGANNYIINPLYYQLLGSALGKQVFQDIIAYRYQVDVDGNISDTPFFDKDNPPSSKYAGIGLDEFRRNYYEIMDYFREKRKAKASKIYKLEQEASSVFMSKIPVYTTKLRQQSLTADTFYYEGIDKKINPIFNISEILKKSSRIERPNLLMQIQKNVNDIWQYNFDLLNGKEGIIRNIILGGSLRYNLAM